MTGSVIDLVTLGRAAVLRNGRSLSISPESPEFLLLVFLAVEGSARRPRLRELFWPHLPDDEGDARLAEALEQLEALLEADLIRREGDEIRVDPRRLDVDVAQIRSAMEEGRPWDVFSIYRGPFLEVVDLGRYGEGESAPEELRSWVLETRHSLASTAERARMQASWGPETHRGFWGRLVREVRSRSVLYATLLYLGFAGGSIQVSSVLVENTGLPDSTFYVVLGLLAVGLPLVVVGVWILEELEKERTGAADGEAPGFKGGGPLARTRLRNVHLVSLLGVLALASVTGWLVIQWGAGTGVSDAWAELPQEKGIAVLPFRTADGEPFREALNHDLVEAINSHLSRVEGLQGTLWVVPRADIQEQGTSSAQDAHRQFGVTLVVSGLVERSGEIVDVTLELADARQGEVLRSSRFSAPVTDARRIEAGVWSGLADLLDLEVTETEREILTSGRTEDRLAHGLYAQGRQYLERFEREQSVEYAIELFTRALDRDPEYVLARAGLAEAYLRRFDLARDLADLERGREVAEEALAQSDEIAAVHVTMGLIQVETGRHDRAIESLQRALELEPHSAEAHLALARAFRGIGETAQAEIHYREALDLRPGYWGGHNELGRFYYGNGRMEDAAEAFAAVVELAPDNHRGWYNLGGVRQQMGDRDGAEEAFQKSISVLPNAVAFSNLGTLYFDERQYGAALENYEQALELNERDYRVWSNLAAAIRQGGVGRQDRAEEACRRAVELAQAHLNVNPRSTEAMTRLATCHEMLGEEDRARVMLRRAVDEAPDDPFVLFNVGDTYEDLGDREQAVRWISAALERGLPLREIEGAPGLADLRGDPRIQEAMERARQPTNP